MQALLTPSPGAYGLVERDVPIPGPDEVLTKGLSILGIVGWQAVDCTRALEAIKAGRVQVGPLITHRLSLNPWEEAFDLATVRKGESAKVVFTF